MKESAKAEQETELQDVALLSTSSGVQYIIIPKSFSRDENVARLTYRHAIFLITMWTLMLVLLLVVGRPGGDESTQAAVAEWDRTRDCRKGDQDMQRSALGHSCAWDVRLGAIPDAAVIFPLTAIGSLFGVKYFIPLATSSLSNDKV